MRPSNSHSFSKVVSYLKEPYCSFLGIELTFCLLCAKSVNAPEFEQISNIWSAESKLKHNVGRSVVRLGKSNLFLVGFFQFDLVAERFFKFSLKNLYTMKQY